VAYGDTDSKQSQQGAADATAVHRQHHVASTPTQDREKSDTKARSASLVAGVRPLNKPAGGNGARSATAGVAPVGPVSRGHSDAQRHQYRGAGIVVQGHRISRRGTHSVARNNYSRQARPDGIRRSTGNTHQRKPHGPQGMGRRHPTGGGAAAGCSPDNECPTSDPDGGRRPRRGVGGRRPSHDQPRSWRNQDDREQDRRRPHAEPAHHAATGSPTERGCASTEE